MGSGPMITDLFRLTYLGFNPMFNYSLFKVLCIIPSRYLYAIAFRLDLQMKFSTSLVLHAMRLDSS